jgi:mono/diheme cytochrome c family protein
MVGTRRRARLRLTPLPWAVALGLAAAGAVLGLAGCGGSAGPTPEASSSAGSPVQGKGAAVFTQAGCGSCHTLAAAGSSSNIGPDLDQLRPTREAVARQVRSGGGSMPAFSGKLTAAEIQAVAEFVASESGTTKPSLVVAFKPDGRSLGDCQEGDAGCYIQAFGNLAYKDGPKVALGELARDIETTPAVEQVCHPIAHVIGAASLLHFDGNTGKALAEGDPTCGSGFYHGVLQSKLAGVPKSRVASVARTVCSGVRSQSSFFVYYQCVHGLGHGLMLYTRDDLPAALKLCHRLADDFDRVSCTGGVFMENQQPSFGGRSKWLRDDEPLYPCNIVSRFDKLYCYLMVTSQILPRNNWNWKATANLCRQSEADFVAYCFQSYGRDASGSSRQEPAAIRRICAQAGSGQRECVFGAVRDILNNQPNDPRGKQLCEMVGTAFRPYCFFGIGTMIATQYGTPADREKACRGVASGEALKQCVTGAAGTPYQER